MKKSTTIFTAALALLLAALSAPAPALAQNGLIADAKAKCIIGEQIDGYLGVVAGKTASDALRREFRSINQQRKAAYERLAARNGVTTEVTAKLTAEKLINDAPAGHCVQDASGTWIRKS